MSVAGGIPAFFVNRPTGFDFFDKAGYDETACRSGSAQSGITLGLVGDTVTISSMFDGWGYVHLYSTTPDGDGKLADLDQFAIPEAFDPTKATGHGDLSVHEAATSHTMADIVYFSYYSGGFRVLQIVDDELTEVGAFIDETEDGGNNFWGVQVFSHAGHEYVAASDRDYGLYIFEFNPGG
jgi:hypothetical protein